MARKPRITFKREEHRTGLARVTQGTRGWDIRVDGEDVGEVAVDCGLGPASRYARVDEERWYWRARVAGSWRNTYSEQLVTAAEAKEAAKKWIRQVLEKASDTGAEGEE